MARASSVSYTHLDVYKRQSLFRIMRELKEQGVALVYISHKMDEIKVLSLIHI